MGIRCYNWSRSKEVCSLSAAAHTYRRYRRKKLAGNESGHSRFEAISWISFYLLRRNRFLDLRSVCITSNADADYNIFKSGDGYMWLSKSYAEERMAGSHLLISKIPDNR